MENVIEAKNLYKIYREGEGEVRALDGVSLTIRQGEFLAIVGQSGSGKSTLMNVLGCLDAPTSGVYYLSGENVSRFGDRRLSEIRNRMIGFVFQGFNLIGGLSALENVELPLLYRGLSQRKRRELAEKALSQVGLFGRMNHLPGQMSGGQQQRVAIARAIAASPPVVLADEPTGNLDSKSGESVMEILHALHQGGRTIVLITHDDKVAAQAQRILRLQDGRVVSSV